MVWGCPYSVHYLVDVLDRACHVAFSQKRRQVVVYHFSSCSYSRNFRNNLPSVYRSYPKARSVKASAKIKPQKVISHEYTE